jgi:hypothetical protein
MRSSRRALMVKLKKMCVDEKLISSPDELINQPPWL